MQKAVKFTPEIKKRLKANAKKTVKFTPAIKSDERRLKKQCNSIFKTKKQLKADAKEVKFATENKK